MDLLSDLDLMTAEDNRNIKIELDEISRMISGLIKNNESRD